ncbi:MAG: cation:proton antiporter [Mycobacterium sp.]
MSTQTTFVLTILVLCYAVVSGLIVRARVAPALVFVACGILVGPYGLGWLTTDAHSATFTVLAQMALTIMLFNQATTLDLRATFRRPYVARRLLLVGFPVTVALGTLAAHLLLPALPLFEAVCLAVIVAPTEVALIEALVQDRRIPEQVRHAFSVESGFYDGLALASLLVALAMASEQTDHVAGRWIGFLVRTEGVSTVAGVAIGAVGAAVMAYARRRSWMTDTWAQLTTPTMALACFEVGEHLHGSGFVTAFAGGLAYTFVASRQGRQPEGMQVSDAAAELLELLVFATFGGFAVVPAFGHADWRVLIFAIVAVFVIRIAAVGLALAGTGLPRRDTLFIGWFGPRGIGTLVTALLVLRSGEIQQTSLIVEVAVVAVTLSLLVHGLTVPLGLRRYPLPSTADTSKVP